MGSGGGPPATGGSGGSGSVDPDAGDASPAGVPEVSSGVDVASDAPGADLDVNPTGPNLFLNPDFAAGLQNWQTSVEVKSDSIKMAGAGTVLIHGDDGIAMERALDLFQTLTTNGKPYVVSFEFQRRDMKGTRPGQVFCQQAGAPRTVYGLATCTINTMKAICRTACAPPAGVMVNFGLHGGQSNLDFYVDMPSLRQ